MVQDGSVGLPFGLLLGFKGLKLSAKLAQFVDEGGQDTLKLRDRHAGVRR